MFHKSYWGYSCLAEGTEKKHFEVNETWKFFNDKLILDIHKTGQSKCINMYGIPEGNKLIQYDNLWQILGLIPDCFAILPIEIILTVLNLTIHLFRVDSQLISLGDHLNVRILLQSNFKFFCPIKGWSSSILSIYHFKKLQIWLQPLQLKQLFHLKNNGNKTVKTMEAADRVIFLLWIFKRFYGRLWTFCFLLKIFLSLL